MRYFKIIKDGYITTIGKGIGGEEITEEEYIKLLTIIKGKPQTDIGYDYILKENLTWEQIEVPVVEEDENGEISDEDALNIIVEGV